MITHLFMMSNDIYQLFHLDNSSQKQKFVNALQGNLPPQQIYNHAALLHCNLCK